jgi:hypothetical protein
MIGSVKLVKLSVLWTLTRLPDRGLTTQRIVVLVVKSEGDEPEIR